MESYIEFTIKPVLEKGFKNHNEENFFGNHVDGTYPQKNQQSEIRILSNVSKSLDIHSCDSQTFQKSYNCSRIIGTRIFASRMGRIHVS